MLNIVLFIFITLFISSCGTSNNNPLNKQTAYLIDSAISGAEYTCDNIKGITSFNGEFTYNNSCEIIFTVGGVLIGQISSEDINEDKNVLPADLFGLNRENTQDERLVKLIQFLQSIDNDNNPYNNIEITQDLRNKLKYHFLDFTNTSMNEDEIFGLIQDINKKLVSKEKALEHYKKTLSSKFDIILEVKDEVNDIFEEKTEVKDSLFEEVKNKSSEEEEVLSKKIIETPDVNKETKEEKEILSVQTQEQEFIQKQVVQIQQSIKNDLIQEQVIQEKEVIQEEETDEKIKQRITDVIVNLESKNIKEQEEKGFSYNNQRDVTINITTKEILYNKEIIIYEKNTVYKTPVGNTEKLENKIVATVFDEKGELNLTYTLGNHIQSVWIVIPYFRLRVEVSISNNTIDLDIEN